VRALGRFRNPVVVTMAEDGMAVRRAPANILQAQLIGAVLKHLGCVPSCNPDKKLVFTRV
jgi:hypothetical protein